jgi:competence protein ComEC
MRSDISRHGPANPALVVAACLAAGIAVAVHRPALGLCHWLALAAVGYILAAAGRLVGRNRIVSLSPLFETAGALIVVFAVGAAVRTAGILVPATHIVHQIDRETDPALVEGRVVDVPGFHASTVRFTLDVSHISRASGRAEVSGRIAVSVAASETQPERLRIGDVVQVHGMLEALPERRNPADFDYGSYLRRRGIMGRMHLRNMADLTLLGHSCQGIECPVAGARSWISGQMPELFPSHTARVVLAALILGDRSGIDEASRGRFARTGLMHLLAVSGLHVLLVGMVLYALLRPMLVRSRLAWRPMELARSLITMCVLLFYMLLTGSGAPVVRAVVMAGLMMGRVLLQRNAPPLNTLGVAAIVLLLFRPEQLFEAGFQLSFSAVAGIVRLNPVLMSAIPEKWLRPAGARYVAGTTTVSLAATLGTAPVLLHHFGYVATGGLVLNLAAIPITTLALGGGLVAVILAAPAPAMAKTFGAAADLMTRLLDSVAAAGDAAFSWAVIPLRIGDVWGILALSAMIVALAVAPQAQRRWRFLALSVFFAAAGLLTNAMRGDYRPTLDVLFLDVGQGDAALITLPNGRTLLIDAGPKTMYTDAGDRVILPHLDRFGIDRLDAVVITHPHSDHLGGLPVMLRNVPISRVVDNGRHYESALFATTLHLLDSLDVPRQSVLAGDTLQLDPSTRIHILGPPRDRPELDENDASVVLRIVFGRTSFLFLGDAERRGEQHLVESFPDLLRSDVVKVGHHGSRTSSTQPLLNLLKSEGDAAVVPVISVAQRNSFGLPNEEVVVRWADAGTPLWLTSGGGALWLRSDGTQITRRDWR